MLLQRKKIIIWRLKIVIISVVVTLLSCEEEPIETLKYDVFPLCVGNEYYYSYVHGFGLDEVSGTVWCNNKKMTITSVSDSNGVKIYNFECLTYNNIKYEGAFIYSDIIRYYNTDTIILENEISYFKVSENQIGEFTLHGFDKYDGIFHFGEDFLSEYSFQKYLDVMDTLFFSGYEKNILFSLHCVADSGITNIFIDHNGTYSMFANKSFYTLDSLLLYK